MRCHFLTLSELEVPQLISASPSTVADPNPIVPHANGHTKNGETGDASHGDDSDEDEHDNVGENGGADTPNGDAAPKKKKKKPKKKKKAGAATSAAKAQTSPPRVPVSQLFPDNSYPEGEIVEYKNENHYRTTNEEKRYLDRMNQDYLSDYRQAATVHRQVRKWAKSYIHPGQNLTDIANGIEDGVRHLVGHMGLEEGDGLKAGVGFPTGLSINHCAAHYSPNMGCKVHVGEDDVMKVDFGVHVNGHILDSAFTVAFNPRYDPLLKAVKDATNTGVREAGIDVRMSDIGAAIQEVMESYEVEIGGNTIPVKAIRNLNGHDIGHYQIHGGKSVPIVKGGDQTKMEEGEAFAIETFGSTGKGYVRNEVSIHQSSIRNLSLTTRAVGRDLSLCAQGGCAQGVSASIFSESAPQFDQEELRHIAILQTVPRPVRSREVPARSTSSIAYMLERDANKLISSITLSKVALWKTTRRCWT